MKIITLKEFLLLEKSEEQEVWHGSPHNFTKFSRKNTAHSGEGGAAYGSGLYVSNNRQVGEHYRDMKSGGTLYHAKMHTDPKRMLHWHKPINDQHPVVKKAIEKVGFPTHEHNDPHGRHVFHWLRKTGKDYGYSAIDASEHATRALKSHGVHGVTYNGDMEGKTTEKPINHVIFDHRHLSIHKRYNDKGHEI